MNDENDEGHFDDDGNFIWNKEDTRVQEEAWLDGVSQEQIGAALHAKNQRDFRDEQGVETMTEEKANRILSTLLNSRETVLQALQRLGSKRAKNRGTKRKQAQTKAATPVPAAQTPEEKAQFEQITDAADFLMRMGEVEVYSQIKEEFMAEEDVLAQRRAAGRVTFADENGQEEEGKSEERPPLAKPETLWEYRGADGQIHGPFPSSSFVAWQQQGYFTGDSAADIRQVQEPKTDSEAEAKQQEKAPEEPKAEPDKLSAEQELLNDFEDSEDEDAEDTKPTEENGGQKSTADSNEAETNPWKRSDEIDFSAY
ncbi:Cd2 antigen cytoplasmic tail-binding protein 2 [Globisporangium polare]